LAAKPELLAWITGLDITDEFCVPERLYDEITFLVGVVFDAMSDTTSSPTDGSLKIVKLK
jgi:hypothetical protein